jgi:hypothetical protein
MTYPDHIIAQAREIAERHYPKWCSPSSFVINALCEALTTTPSEEAMSVHDCPHRTTATCPDCHPEPMNPKPEPTEDHLRRACEELNVDRDVTDHIFIYPRDKSHRRVRTVARLLAERDAMQAEIASLRDYITEPTPDPDLVLAREAAESCATCRFHKPDDRPEQVGSGHCRRFPPAAAEQVSFDGSGSNYFSQVSPWMAADDWCGEYRALKLKGQAHDQ